ncbi:ribonuclease HII [uncultured Sphingomonas sp.]|uniref:ribonuclease HII n=1 Tax=uncultured Sphingomonas sp. TaxID=158754 RepID=UPI0035CC6ABD
MSGTLAGFDRGFPGPVAGVDEVGRGPLAGPVVAAAVILPAGFDPAGIDDSKKLSPAVRERAAARITATAAVGLAIVEADEIDRLNIHGATLVAMARAVAALTVRPGHVLVDGKFLPALDYPATAVIGGDARSLSIAAASIVAKVARDRIMVAAAQAHPHYDWASNKGYPAPRHLAALVEHGPTPLHRRSFAPVARAYLAR